NPEPSRDGKRAVRIRVIASGFDYQGFSRRYSFGADGKLVAAEKFFDLFALLREIMRMLKCEGVLK
ncbi:unnamed protein product, partial [marine sediment metagenome]